MAQTTDQQGMRRVRSHGILTKWNDQRGFGFIEPANGAAELFVHVSAFPRDGVRPRIGELVSFAIATGPDGKPRATEIGRPGAVASTRPGSGHRRRGKKRSSPRLAVVLCLLTLMAVAYYGGALRNRPATPPVSAAAAPSENLRLLRHPHPPAFSCDGRTRCSQMSSCAEATFFIQHCPATQMDGDGDGTPCESQWCDAAYPR